MVFLISAVISRRIGAYKSTLTSYSGSLLPFIEWEATPRGNLRVLNDTADFYWFFDATAHVENLYGCVQQTIEEDLPRDTQNDDLVLVSHIINHEMRLVGMHADRR